MIGDGGVLMYPNHWHLAWKTHLPFEGIEARRFPKTNVEWASPTCAPRRWQVGR